MTHDSFVRFHFTGGLADEGQLNFYEAGRFMYAASRLLYVIDRFRQEEIVVKKIVKNINVDMRVSTSKDGSFIQDILLLTPFMAQAAVQAPVQVLVSHFMDFFLHPSKAQDAAAQIAHHNYLIEIEKTKQISERERTKQSEQETARLEIFARVAEGKNSKPEDSLSIIKNANQRRISIPDDLEPDRGKFGIYERELDSYIKRRREIDPYKDTLDSIDDEKARQMAGRVHGLIPELGVPLRLSADALHISSGDSEDNKVIYLNEKIVKSISKNDIDDNETVLRGKIKRYDYETGHGQFRIKGDLNYVPFKVRSTKNSNATIHENTLKEITAAFYIVRDLSGNPIQMIFSRALDDDVGKEE